MVRIRLKRTGARNLPCYRVVVMDQRSTRDGRSIEEIGFYDPKHNKETLQIDRYDFWIARGAQPSDTVADLARRVKNPEAEAKRQEEAQAKKDAAAKKKAEEAAKEAAKKAEAEKAEKAEEEKAEESTEAAE